MMIRQASILAFLTALAMTLGGPTAWAETDGEDKPAAKQKDKEQAKAEKAAKQAAHRAAMLKAIENAKLSFSEAASRAEAETGGQATKVEYKLQKGKDLIIVVQTMTDSKTSWVRFDAVTGEAIKGGGKKRAKAEKKAKDEAESDEE